MAQNNSGDERLDKLALAILEEMRFEQDLADFREGKIDPSVRLPNLAEAQERFMRRLNAEAAPSKTVWRQIPELLLTCLQSFSPQFQVQGALDATRFKSVGVPWGAQEVEIYVWRKQRGIAFYTADAGLVGKTLVIKGETAVTCRFVVDDTTEGMRASCFLHKDAAAGLELGRGLQVGIED